MKIEKIIVRLKQIENIAKHQQKRLKEKKAEKKRLILKQSLDIIGFHILNILDDLEE